MPHRNNIKLRDTKTLWKNTIVSRPVKRSRVSIVHAFTTIIIERKQQPEIKRNRNFLFNFALRSGSPAFLLNFRLIDEILLSSQCRRMVKRALKVGDERISDSKTSPKPLQTCRCLGQPSLYDDLYNLFVFPSSWVNFIGNFYIPRNTAELKHRLTYHRKFRYYMLIRNEINEIKSDWFDPSTWFLLDRNSWTATLNLKKTKDTFGGGERKCEDEYRMERFRFRNWRRRRRRRRRRWRRCGESEGK